MPRTITEADLPQAIQQRRQQQRTAAQELTGNELTGVRLAQVDAKIDALANLADLKVFLKKLTRYIIASRGG